MPKKFYIYPAEKIYKVSGKTKEDIWVSHPVGPFALDTMRARRHKERMDFAKLVTNWREKRGLNRAEAARLLDVPYRTLQDWEAGLRKPRGIALKLITKKLVR